MSRPPHPRICLLLVRGAASSPPACAPAPDLPAEVTLEQCLELLDKHSPRALAEQATVQVVAADRIAAQTLPNPTLNYGGLHRRAGPTPAPQPSTSSSSSSRCCSSASARRGSQPPICDVEAEQARVASRSPTGASRCGRPSPPCCRARTQLQVLEESLDDLQRVEGVVRGRATAGDRSQYDVARIEVETEALRVQVVNKRTDVEEASGQLAALLGLPGWSPRAIGTLEPGDVPTDVDDAVADGAGAPASLVAVRERQAAARRRVHRRAARAPGRSRR